MDHRDTFVEDVVDVGAGLGAAPLVEVGDGVVVGVGWIILCPLMLDDTARVFLITITVQGIFYCCDVTE